MYSANWSSRSWSDLLHLAVFSLSVTLWTLSAYHYNGAALLAGRASADERSSHHLHVSSHEPEQLDQLALIPPAVLAAWTVVTLGLWLGGPAGGAASRGLAESSQSLAEGSHEMAL